MKKLILLSLAGITSMALTHAGWAAGHGGGGGGFHGGGFGGGRGFGGGARGGGFGGARSSTFSPFGARPSYRQPLYNAVNRSATPSIRSPRASTRLQNRLASPSNQAAPTSRFLTPSYGATIPQQNGLNGRTDHIYQGRALDSHPDWDRRRAYYSNNHWWAYNGYDWIGLDSGFFPWDYYPYYTYDYYPYDYFVSDPTDLPPAYQGATSSPPAPDPTVAAAQTQLSQQGYYGGPIDGLFGPTTRDAVARFQTNQNLTVTGSLTPDTVQALGLPQVVTN